MSLADDKRNEAKRAETRYRCAVPVLLRKRTGDEALLTSDVSFRGAYVRTTHAPPANSLVRLTFTLPPDDAEVTVSAHIIRVAVRSEGQDQYPGFATRFMGLGGPAKERWEKHIAWLRSSHVEAIRTTVTFARPSYVRLFQQRAPTVDDLWLRPASVEDLQKILEHEVPSGVLSVPSTASLAPGVNTTVRIAHPVTDDVVTLRGVVRRRGEDAAEGHVVVKLDPLTDEMRTALTEVAGSVLVIDDYAIELYSDPHLAQKLVIDPEDDPPVTHRSGPPGEW